MKTLLFTACLLVAAVAHARPDSMNMTCAEAKNLVDAHGAIVIGTGPHIYDRYVAHGGYCMSGEVAKPAWIETADDFQCMVGYRCAQDDRGQ